MQIRNRIAELHDEFTILLMRQLKIDVLSVLVVTDKLEFVGLKARGILSPIGRHFP